MSDIMTQIISTPYKDNRDTIGKNDQYQFGYFELSNLDCRDQQEDALAWHVLTENELTPTGSSAPLTPKEIGHRLWTSYQLLDKPELIHGSTASTTVYDGRGNLITATLADATTFAVVYGKKGEALGVLRLNAVTHKPTNENEYQRITNAGGSISWGRVNGRLAVSRAIGDSPFKASGVCSEANIDITNVKKIAEDLHLDPKDIGSMQIISTCDGFTDGAGERFQTKKDHENYLLGVLKKIKSPGTLSPEKLSKELALQAKIDGSTDNISVAIQTLTLDTPAFLLGVYDGHAGQNASRYAAQNIGTVFKNQCALSPADYKRQDLSVPNKSSSYKRDNPEANPVASLDRNGLVSFLSSSITPPSQDIKDVPKDNCESEAGKVIQQVKMPQPPEAVLNPDDVELTNTETFPVQKLTTDLANSVQEINRELAPPNEHPIKEAPITGTEVLAARVGADNGVELQECEAIVKQLFKLTRDYQVNLHLDERVIERTIRRILSDLLTILTDERNSPQDKIKSFYTLLDKKRDDAPTLKNIDVIKMDKSILATNYFKGIAIIATTIVTGIIPGLLIAAIVYRATGRQPFDLFKTNSERLEKEVGLIKAKNPAYATFFQPDSATDETREPDLEQAPKNTP